MKKNKRYFLVISFFLIGILLLPINCLAADDHGLSFRAVKCPMSNYESETGDNKYWTCFDDYAAGNLDTYVIGNNDNIDPGTVMMLIVDYTLGSASEITGINATINYDSESWTPIISEETTSVFSYYDSSLFPKPTRGNSTWTVEIAETGTGTLTLVASDLTNFLALKDNIELGYVFIQLNEDVTPGKSLTISYNTDNVNTQLSNANQISKGYTATDMILSVYGSESQDASLKELNITNDSTTYTLSPEFVSGDVSNLEYSTVVPYDITEIDISAEVNNEYAYVLEGYLGTKSLNVGENTFQIIVSSQLGNTVIYEISVYRLSNDVTLKELSLTNDITLTEESDGKYTADIPFATKDTYITATTTHDGAYVDSGDGSWTFEYSGDTPNTKDITVMAENCLDEYSDVPGNSCDSKTYSITINREAASPNNYLSDLTVAGTTVADFDKTITEYDLGSVSYETINLEIGGVVEDTGKATIISGTGNANLKVGDNTIEVVVQAEDGSKNTYTIKVRRLSNDTSLISLTVTSNPEGTLSPVFSSTFTGEYTYTYDPTVTEVTISATVNDLNNATIFITDISDGSTPSGVGTLNTASETFSISSTKIAVVVTAEDGTIQVYPVNLNRLQSSNTDLSDLQIDGVTVDGFVASTQVYYVTVPGLTSEITVSAEVAAVGKATILTDLNSPFALNFGSNSIAVTVQAENGDTKTYTLIVTRANGIDATLSDLQVNGVTVDGFDPEIEDYVLDDVDYNTNSVNISATPTDSLANVTGTGLISLSTGENEIVIIVTAHDTTVKKRYTISVNRELNNDTGIKGIALAGVAATYNIEDNVYEVTVPFSISEANESNLDVDVNDPITTSDKEATYTFTTTPLVTTATNEIVITVKAEDGTTKDYTLVVTREKAAIATLKSLTVATNSASGSNGSFNPSFDPDTGTYEVTVPVDTTTIIVDGVKTDVNATVSSGFGRYDMTESSKTVEVVVVSENEQVTKTYTLNVVRTKSTINTLSEITIDGETISGFNPNTTSYTINVDGSVESIDVGAIVSDNRASISYGTGVQDLDVGENTITIRVLSESGSPLDYTIKVIRAQKADNALLDLTVDGNTVPNFDPDVLDYIIEDAVPYTKTSVNIGAILSDAEDATVSGTGLKGLATGENTLSVVVTAQNGNTRTYTIKITRTKNSNANLDILSVNGYTLTPSFDSDTTEYTVTVDETKDTLGPSDVTARAADSNATVTKQTAINLSTTEENTYIVEVLAENGVDKKTYTINVIRPKSTDTSLSRVDIIGATLTPTFDSNKNEYTLTVPYGSSGFTIDAIPNVSTTTVVGDGDFTLDNCGDQIVITTTSESGETETYTFNVVEAASNDASLASLSVTGYPFTETFDKTDTTYSIGSIPYSTSALRVAAEANNADAKIEYYVNGIKQDDNILEITPNVGTNNITVKVTAPDGITTKSYIIDYTITLSNNAYLEYIRSAQATIDFNKTKTEYDITLDNDVTSITFSIKTEDENASIKIDGQSYFTPKDITLNDLRVGQTTLTILVTAQNGTDAKTYTVVINRLAPVASSDANLSSLSVTDYPFDKTFSMEETDYSIGSIPYGVTELTVNATANMGSSKIAYLVNGVTQTSNVVTIPKVAGNGAITVKVTAEDGTTVKNYKISYSKTPSSNAYLSNIVLSSGTLAFNKNTLTYTVNLDRTVNSIDITATTEDNTAIMSMNGTVYTSPHTLTISPLNAGKTSIPIVVTAEDGTVLHYTIVLDREADPATTITSVEYGHNIVNNYIKTVSVDTTELQMKDQLDNENEYLEIWTADESRKVTNSEKLATGMIVKLIIDGEEKDRKIIVIKGDTSGDGIIDLFDAVKILNHYLERTYLTGAYLEAGYTNDDVIVDLFDAVMVLNHYLERSSLH